MREVEISINPCKSFQIQLGENESVKLIKFYDIRGKLLYSTSSLINNVCIEADPIVVNMLSDKNNLYSLKLD